MPTIKDLQLYLSRFETTLDESKLLLQKEGGLDGELKTSGWICESSFARLFKDSLYLDNSG